MQVVTHEDYLAAVATAVCEQYPATAASLSEVRLVFGAGPRRRGIAPLHRVWGGGEAVEPLPLVEIAAIGGLAPAATCHVVLHELAHVLAPGFGHGREWRYAARQVGLMKPRAWPDAGELNVWGGDLAGDPSAAAGDCGADRASAGGVLGGLAPATVRSGVWDARRRQPWRGVRQPLPEGGVRSTGLRLPGAGDAQVAGAGRAALRDRRAR